MDIQPCRQGGVRRRRMGNLMALLLIVSLLQPSWQANASSGAGLQGTLHADEAGLPADGTSRATVTLVLRDGSGDAVELPPDRIRLQATLGTWAGPPTAQGDGTYIAELTAPTTAGISYISAEAAGATVTDLARVHFKPGPPSPERSVLTASRTSLPADGRSRTLLTLRLKDRYGNDIADPAESVRLSATGGELGTVTHVAYGRYAANLVSAAFGRIGSLTSAADAPLELSQDWESGAIPEGTPNEEPLPVSLSFAYESYGAYEAELTAPSTEGGAEVTVSLNGATVASSVYVAFSHQASPLELVSLQFGRSSYAMEVGGQQQVEVSAVWSDRSATRATALASYRMEDGSIAAVDEKGAVRGLKPGRTILTAEYEGSAASVEIVVAEPERPVTPEPTATPGQPEPSAPPVVLPPLPSVPGPSAPPAEPDAALRADIVSANGTAESAAISLEAIRQGVVLLDFPSAGGEIRLSGAVLREIARLNPQAALLLRQAGGAALSVPIAELSAKPYGEKFGVGEEAVHFHFKARTPDEAVEAAVEQAADRAGARKLSQAASIDIQVTGGNGRSAFLSVFNRYATYTVPLSAGAVPTTATGVVWDAASNRLAFVPTRFEQQDGRWTAVMIRQGGGVFAVIDRPASFRDTQGHWGQASMERLASKLIFEGRGPGVFAPDAPITRAEVAALLVRSLGLADAQTGRPFLDTAGGWYEQAVSTAYRTGLITGYEDGSFRPGRSVTRQELVTMVVAAMAYTGEGPDASARKAVFADEGEIADWAQASAVKAAEAGIIVGNGGEFRPASPSTRAETAVMLERMLKLVRFI
ncbi:hypothetical protein HGI30_22755 [Paenibacillus albicereus]|uniref:SLH domain-containing protein n=1 Tax=Paenibacillus albicereus TaxID=2726185 RepID=A0A6H2H2Y7_9BACL|nr:invasin domain 3-containing protein [Paenibacillus albicereus]QJC54063.1 hypothetical protein HGI30_22755 [Paenibacillus albicereus]